MALSLDALWKFGNCAAQLQTFPLFCIYLLMILLAGVWQRYTKPMSLRLVLIVYNFTCSAISMYTFITFMIGLFLADHIYQKTMTAELSDVFYYYHLTKILELMDTVFMIVRHKRQQISFLHIYHHASMLLLSDYAYHYSAWPAIAVILSLNSFVHVVLYWYYGLTALDSTSRPTWKRRLTELQIVQFYIDLIFTIYGYLYHGFCFYGFIYGMLMIYLFSNFYYHAYVKSNRAKTHARNKNGLYGGKSKKLE